MLGAGAAGVWCGALLGAESAPLRYAAPVRGSPAAPGSVGHRQGKPVDAADDQLDADEERHDPYRLARPTGEDERGEEHGYDAVEQPPAPARQWPKPEGSEDAHDALEEEHPGEDQRHRHESRPGLPQQVETDPHIERAEEH